MIDSSAMASSAAPCVPVLYPSPPRHHMAILKLLDVRAKEIIADEGNQFREKSTPEIIIKNMEDKAVDITVLQETWKVTPTGVAIEELGKYITD